jgi:hypothetical protein
MTNTHRVTSDDIMFTATHEINTGTETIYGKVERTSDTAALINGKWFPFHGPNGLVTTKPVTPLVTFHP